MPTTIQESHLACHVYFHKTHFSVLYLTLLSSFRHVCYSCSGQMISVYLSWISRLHSRSGSWKRRSMTPLSATSTRARWGEIHTNVTSGTFLNKVLHNYHHYFFIWRNLSIAELKKYSYNILLFNLQHGFLLWYSLVELVQSHSTKISF